MKKKLGKLYVGLILGISLILASMSVSADCTDGDTRPTTCGVGACLGNTGIETCSAGNWTGNTCNPLAGATAEICDGKDNNCDGSTDEGYVSHTCGIGACQAQSTCVNGLENCIPGSPSAEICDGKDNNCDGTIDEGLTTTFYKDSDSDGYGNPASPKQLCSPSQGYVKDNTDCNDANAAIHPGATEIGCDQIDQDCNGVDACCRINAPFNKNYNTKKVALNVTLTEQTGLLKYMDHTKKAPTTRTLCRNCDGYGDIIPKTLLFDEGQNNFSIFTEDGVCYQSMSFFVDSTAPKVTELDANNKGFCKGSFVVKYTEDYPTGFKLNYGSHSMQKECPAGKDQACEFNVDLKDLENQVLAYNFEVKDAFNTVSYKKDHTCMVDTIPPKISKLAWKKAGNGLYLNISLDQKAQSLKYIDYESAKPREIILCPNCKEYGVSKAQKNIFRSGNHSIAIIAEDAAGNRETSEPIKFTI